MHDPHPLSVVPFCVLLLCIALLPLLAPARWEHNRDKAAITALISLPVAAWLAFRHPTALLHSALEYVSFLTLLAALFIVTGGIHLEGDLIASPGRNTLLLLLGAVLANLLGTTGASMLLIRTFLRTNSQRENREHLPFFFILIVANCGGLLTPLGDPPLFLGYLRGVPFTWTLRLFPVWLLAVGWLLALFYFVDRRAYRRESAQRQLRDRREAVPLKVLGKRNIPLLLAVVAAVLLPSPWRELCMAGLSALSLLGGARTARTANAFSFAPIIEVATLFAGIFITMVPALALLEQHGAELGLSRPWQFFLVTGSLSSVLDNAPTYLTFLSAAQSLGLTPQVAGVPHTFLAAISAGAVLMGANTYIGNGPNFMVKAIADLSGYQTASFARHALTALLVLSPVYLMTVLWLSY